MAQLSMRRRRQLGEPAIGLRQIANAMALLFCLFFTSCSTHVSKPNNDLSKSSWGRLSPHFLDYERPTQGDTCVVASPTPTEQQDLFPPVGKLSTEAELHIPDQPAVHKYISFYQNKGRLTFIDGLERSWLHLPVMVEILESHGVPAELIYVVLVESSFKGKAIGPGGSGGYWQLMRPTARSLGLRVDRWVDERMDPIKSTEAAAKYLRAMYERYQSWPLALAAYNAGDGPVQKAIRRCGTSDFWTISKQGSLPKITRAYVPKILAAIKIARNLEDHHFDSPKYLPVFDFESIYVKSPLRLQQVAQWLGLSVKQLRLLNPSLCKDRLPPDEGFSLRLPPGAKGKFQLAYEDYLNG